MVISSVSIIIENKCKTTKQANQKEKEQKNNNMAFNFSKDDFRKSQKCPAGMHIATLVEVEEPYIKDNGNEVQKCWFETSAGHQVPYWFNKNMPGPVFEFTGAADNVVFTEENAPENIELKEYKGKRVAISVSHRQTDKGIMPNIDAFYSADKVPF